MEKNELIAELEGLKSTLEASVTEKTKADVAEALKAFTSDVDAKLEAFKGDTSADSVKEMTEEFNALKSQFTALTEGFDVLQTSVKNQKSSKVENQKTFNEVFADSLKENQSAIEAVKKGQPFRMELKAVGNMLLSTNLTGDGTASYSARQAVLPSQKVNFRDLISTAVSPTGLYVQYRESGGEGTIGAQSEGASKNQVDYDFTEIKIVEGYIAGYSRFSKQMAKQLPYMQSTLPRLLQRDFFKAENNSFYITVTGAATGSTVGATGTDVVADIMTLIGNQQAANFNASYAVVNPATLAALNKELLTNGFYPGAGGVVSGANGTVNISGTTVVAASWATKDTVLIFDMDYLERVETEAVNVEFSMEDADNFTKNLITARIECQEQVNLMLPTSAIFYDWS
jgi:hypothetical protein